MLQESGARAIAYQVLDRVLAERTVAPGLRGAVFSVIDSLRVSSASAEELRCAESISICLHRLESAMQGRDENIRSELLDELKSLAATWLNARICGPLAG